MKKFFCVRQHDDTDCGAACLATVFKNYGLKIPLAKIRQEAGTDTQGTNAYGMIETAAKFGFDAKAVEADNNTLFSDYPLPAIAHIITKKDTLHFVVIHKITDKYIIIADPAKGIVKYKSQEFLEIWTHLLILISPNEYFKPGNEMKGALKRFFPLLKTQKWLFIKVFLSSLIVTMLGIASAFYTQYLLDMIIPNKLENMLIILSLSVIALYFLQSILEWYRAFLFLYLSQRIDLNLFLEYYKHVLRLPMSFFGSRKIGEIISRFQDTQSIRELISGAALTVMMDSIMVIIGGIFLYNQDPLLFGVCFIIIILYAIIVIIYNKRLRESNENVMEDNAQLSSRLVETLSGIQTIKSFNAESQINIEAENRFRKLLKSSFKLNIDINIQNTLKNFLQMISGVIILWFGAYKVFDGSMTVGNLITFNTLLAYFLTPIKNLIDLQPQIQTAIIASERVSEVLDLEVEEEKNEKFELKEFKDKIEITNLFFRYGMRKLVLQDINITIQKGERVAFIGESGCGKTTLAKLLMNFYTPERGNILIDGNDVANITKKSIRDRIAYVPQEIFLLSGTILENLTLGLENINMDEVISISEVTKISDFINEFPLKFKTKVEENGLNFSGGQRQRIAIARALLKKPDILILDEATSNLDTITEGTIQRMINQFNSEMTIIIIAHRLSTIKNCDKIYVFNQGMVVESGDHNSLINGKGLYYDFLQY